jgi:transcriptional regulator of arginine metabolism
MRDRMTWRNTLRDLLTAGQYRTQAQLVTALARRGATVDQSTVSRELRSLGVRKEAGIYRLPDAPTLGAPVHHLAVTANGCLAVIKTDPAFAAVVATALDDLRVDGVLGTVAGDDTVFVALGHPGAIVALSRLTGRAAA